MEIVILRVQLRSWIALLSYHLMETGSDTSACGIVIDNVKWTRADDATALSGPVKCKYCFKG